MTCIVCGNAMEERHEYVWSNQARRVIRKVFWYCKHCGARTRGEER